MPEAMCTVGRGVELCYETFGDPDDPTALLIMGLGMQMIAWHDDFCRDLAQAGFHVVRFDNRDAGRSTHMSGPAPTIGQLIRRSPAAAGYTLADMADDASGLLRELELAPAHVIGASMGGMIAQTLAIRHPQQVRSLVSMMSNTGALWCGQPSLRLYPIFMRPVARSKSEYIDEAVRLFAAIGSRDLHEDEEELREIAARSYERCHDPAASGRQLAAIIASPNRTRALRSLRIPTLVIHGRADRLVRPSGGRATARAVPGARLMTIAGMGHDLPRSAWPRMIQAIAENASRAERGGARKPAARGALTVRPV